MSEENYLQGTPEEELQNLREAYEACSDGYRAERLAHEEMRRCYKVQFAANVEMQEDFSRMESILGVDPHGPESLVDGAERVVKQLLAERERCAKLAETFSTRSDTLGREIVAAIRSGK